MTNVQAIDVYDVTHWTKEQVADWIYNISTTGKLLNMIIGCFYSNLANSSIVRYCIINS